MLLLPVHTYRNLDDDASLRRIDNNVNNEGSIIVGDDDEARPPPRPPQQRRRTTRRRAELVVLPCLTRQADVAMCLFQSDVTASPPLSLSSDVVGESALPPSSSSDRILREAMCANGAYRRALAGAASSLARSASAKVGAQWRRISQR